MHMFGWVRRRREYRNRVRDKASRMIQALGEDAWPTVFRDSRDMELPDEERLFHLAVRREVEKRLGIEPHVDVATRYTDQLRMVVLFILMLSLGSVAWADEARIIGEARVIDGDTLDIGPVRIRLHGIDAPEAGQRCGKETGGSWRCGDQATARLAELVGGKEIECAARDRDHYGRIIAVCYAGEAEVNDLLVREGLAWAFTRYSQDYVAAEAEAQTRLVGVWQGEAETPWDYRANKWERAAAESPRPGCPIKGNINRDGEKIYHTPWSPWYDRTQIDQSKGERWFCDEAEAEAAGWRPARWN
jgi:endonuclease YncB( thermonuclease family)